MKPENEKAKELVKVYWCLCMDIERAKQYALIAVNEILEECILERYWFWQEVKIEIEKL